MGHQMLRLQDVYDKHLGEVKSEIDVLLSKMKDLNTSNQETQSVIEKLTKAKEDAVRELEKHLEASKNRMNQLLTTRLTKLMTQKEEIQNEVTRFETCHEMIKAQINQMTKSQLIAQSEELIEQLRSNQEGSLSTQLLTGQVSYDFPSDLQPDFVSAEFVIKDYAAVKETKEIVYSDLMTSNGLTWRLKVYPNGNGNAKGQFLSVFLEMMKGYKEPSKYDYKIDMIHPTDESEVVSREYQSDFEIGECWGYNRFFRTDNILSGGFISGEDESITLRFYVRASTYAQHSKDQKKYINELETKLKALQEYMESSKQMETSSAHSKIIDIESQQEEGNESLEEEPETQQTPKRMEEEKKDEDTASIEVSAKQSSRASLMTEERKEGVFTSPVRAIDYSEQIEMMKRDLDSDYDEEEEKPMSQQLSPSSPNPIVDDSDRDEEEAKDKPEPL